MQAVRLRLPQLRRWRRRAARALLAQGAARAFVLLVRDGLALDSELLALDSERLALDSERPALDSVRLALDSVRLALDSVFSFVFSAGDSEDLRRTVRRRSHASLI